MRYDKEEGRWYTDEDYENNQKKKESRIRYQNNYPVLFEYTEKIKDAIGYVINSKDDISALFYICWVFIVSLFLFAVFIYMTISFPLFGLSIILLSCIFEDFIEMAFKIGGFVFAASVITILYFYLFK